VTSGRPGVIEMGSVRLEIPDPWVFDQDGRRVRFYSDLIKDRVVVVSFFFTKCTVVCPPQTGALVKLQARLAARLGREVFLVSVTRDPATDTPQHLKRWGEGAGVLPGWTLVTGDEGVMSRLVADFTGANLGQEMHNSILLIGNDRTGTWTTAEALSGTERLLGVIDRVSAQLTSR
jgi:protein SCO1/2